MKSRKFGSSGPQVSVIGQGTWYIDQGNRKTAVAALRRGIDLGMTHIDTAEMYGDAELVVAEAIVLPGDEQRAHHDRGQHQRGVAGGGGGGEWPGDGPRARLQQAE